MGENIVLWALGVFLGLIAWLANRFVNALDGVKEELHHLRISFEKLPTWEDLKAESKRTAHEVLVEHERDKH